MGNIKETSFYRTKEEKEMAILHITVKQDILSQEITFKSLLIIDVISRIVGVERMIRMIFYALSIMFI